MTRGSLKFAFVSVVLGVWASTGFAGPQVPDCLDGRDALPVDNVRVLKLKTSTANAYKARAHVEGQIVRLFPDRNDHLHVEIQIGKNPNDLLEVVYSFAFGSTAEPRVGMRVEACGDYITSTAQTGAYPPSPSGAIIHWLHHNPKNRGHEHGYLMMDGVLYGMGFARGRSR
jgi:hypothetical protein